MIQLSFLPLLLFASHKSIASPALDYNKKIRMLASYLAPYITGQYDVTVVPLSLPSALVTILLPTLWSDGAPVYLTDRELKDAGLGIVPDAGEGRRWAMIQVGKQISTGVGFGPGRKTF